MIERMVYARIEKIADPTLRGFVRGTARLVLENWFYVLAVIALWRFPYLVAHATGSEVMPRRPTGDSAFWQSEMARALALACLAMSYNLLFGYSGIVSFGHALFFGAGGYVTFILLGHYSTGLQQKALVLVLLIPLALALFSRINVRQLVIFALLGVVLVLLLLPASGNITFLQAAGVAVLISILISVVSGVVTLRLRGIYFAMFTLALAEMFWVLAKSGTLRHYAGAEDGLGFRDLLPGAFNPTPTADGSRLHMYQLTVVFFVVVFLAIRRYLNSPVGRVMLAIRENEQRARTIGYNTFFYKVLTMVFAGVIATLSGLLFVVWATDKRVHPEVLSMNYTVGPLLNTLIGGVGTLTGPIVATLGLSLGETYLRNDTFTLHTQLVGLIEVWHVVVVSTVLIVLWASRFPLKQLIERLILRLDGAEPGTPRYRQLRSAAYAGAFLVLTLIGLPVGSQLASESSQVYKVSDLWELFLGIIFVVVVMVLPNGIVGTWNRAWAVRRLHRIERDLQNDRPTEVSG